MPVRQSHRRTSWSHGAMPGNGLLPPRSRTLSVPHTRIETIDGCETKVGRWIDDQRSRRATLTRAVAALDTLGMRYR